MRLSISGILKATGGTLLCGNTDVKIRGVSINSRTAKRGNLFIAIKGKRFDGHQFVNDAFKKSVAAILISKKDVSFSKNVTVIYVSDTTKALGKIARFYRGQFKIPVIAITGSAGKTTTKEMVASVLSRRYRVLKNIATENNHIGVPMTLLNLNSSHEAAVVELGTNHFGEIKYLTRIANPTIAVLTNIGESHLEFFKTRQGVFKEKFDIIRYMHNRGIVVFNNDDQMLRQIKSKKLKHRLVTFGVEQKCGYRAENISKKNNFSLEFQVKDKMFILKSPARQNVCNALAAICCGTLLKVKTQDIQNALKSFRFSGGRQTIKHRGSFTIIDDAYNANPVSVRGAIETLHSLNGMGRKILVCADMLELGHQSKKLHRAMGERAAESRIDLLITVGRLSRVMAEGAKSSNKHFNVFHYDSIQPAYQKLKNFLRPKDVVLIKGSRGMSMEKLIQLLK